MFKRDNFFKNLFFIFSMNLLFLSLIIFYCSCLPIKIDLNAIEDDPIAEFPFSRAVIKAKERLALLKNNGKTSLENGQQIDYLNPIDRDFVNAKLEKSAEWRALGMSYALRPSNPYFQSKQEASQLL